MLSIKERMKVNGMLHEDHRGPREPSSEKDAKRSGIMMQTIEVKYEPRDEPPARKMTIPGSESEMQKMLNSKDQFRPRVRDRIIIMNKFEKPSLPQLEAKSLQDKDTINLACNPIV